MTRAAFRSLRTLVDQKAKAIQHQWNLDEGLAKYAQMVGRHLRAQLRVLPCR